MNRLYIFCGALALYQLETADPTQPWHIGALSSLILCAIPSSLEYLYEKNTHIQLGKRLFGHFKTSKLL